MVRLSLPVLLFAGARELAGAREISVEVEVHGEAGAGMNVVEGVDVAYDALVAAIVAKCPRLSALVPDSAALAHNQCFVEKHAFIRGVRPGDELAVLPPISGG